MLLGIQWQGGAAALHSADRRRLWVNLLFAAALLAYGLGQATWTVEDLVYKSATLPSWADAWYLPGYPLLLAGILMLPTQRVPTTTRVRILLDSLTSMTALVTFSWFYVLGPALLQRYLTPAGKATTLFYPTADLVLLFAVLWLQSRMMTGSMRRIATVLSFGLLATVSSDIYTTYQSLHSDSISISLLDMGWSLGYMPIGLAVSALWLPQEVTEHQQDDTFRPVGLWPSLLPYLLLPAFFALVLCTFRSHMPPVLVRGVYVGGVLMIALVLLRQVLAILENAALNTRLAGSYREVSNSAEQMQQLNEELLAAHDELHRNLSALSEANARLEALATTDAITGLLNHRGAVDAIDAAMSRSQRSGHPCALLFLDLDRFKSLNDTYGHPAGDAALREVGSVLRERTRAGDSLGRWGGEEFVVLLPDTGLAGARVAAEAIRTGVAERTLPFGGGVHMTCSLGLAVSPHHAKDRAGLVDAADRAMYAAKRLGRNQTRTADDPAALAMAHRPTHDDLRVAPPSPGDIETHAEGDVPLAA